MLQPVVHRRIPVPQESSDRTDQSGYRTEWKRLTIFSVSTEPVSNIEIVGKLLQEMQNMGFAECVSELDETFKVTSAFRYVEELVEIIQIANEDEVPE